MSKLCSYLPSRSVDRSLAQLYKSVSRESGRRRWRGRRRNIDKCHFHIPWIFTRRDGEKKNGEISQSALFEFTSSDHISAKSFSSETRIRDNGGGPSQEEDNVGAQAARQ